MARYPLTQIIISVIATCWLSGLADASQLDLNLSAKPKWSAAELKTLERSYWIHATLGASLVKGYWAKQAAVGSLPCEYEIRNAMRLLRTYYGASRLYLIYHNEVPIRDFVETYRIWQVASAGAVDLVPTFVLRSYDKEQREVFSCQEMMELCKELKKLGVRQVAVYDVLPNRDQGQNLALLLREFPEGIIRVGIQPDESVTSPFTKVVEDTWSALCHGKTNRDWASPGFGSETLVKWIHIRNAQNVPVVWDLVAVAWDYEATQRGEYPGYDDARKNMPLPAGRNRLAARQILAQAKKTVLAGFSSDLLIVEANSRGGKRDPDGQTLYQCLKNGVIYAGYFSRPLDEIASIYRDLARGRFP
jgi:hypothetical protein